MYCRSDIFSYKGSKKYTASGTQTQGARASAQSAIYQHMSKANFNLEFPSFLGRGLENISVHFAKHF